MDHSEIALKYEAVLRKRGMRHDALRLKILEALAGSSGFADRKELVKKLQETGLFCDEERIRYVIKRLSAAGLLERKRVLKKNKFLFRLLPLEMIEKGFSMHL